MNLNKIQKLFLFLFIVVFIRYPMNSTPNVSLEFPTQGETGIALDPIITFKTIGKIDTSSFRIKSSFDMDSISIKPNVYLLKTIDLDTFGVNQAKNFLVPCNVYINSDSSSLQLLPSRKLENLTSYSMIVNNNLKIIQKNDLDSNQLDTLNSDSLVFRNAFTTIEKPIDLISNTIIDNNGGLKCSDSIFFKFTDKLFLNEADLSKMFTLTKNGLTESIGGNHYRTLLDTVSITPKYTNDSSKVFVKINDQIDFANAYNLKLKPEALTGSYTGTKDYGFSFKSQAIIDLKFQSFLPTDTLPFISELNGNGQRYLNLGDTVTMVFPKLIPNFYLYKIALQDSNSAIIVDNSIKIIGDCKNISKKQLIVIYDRIPIDTLKLDPIVISTDPEAVYFDNCSKIKVNNFKDSLNKLKYTYERYSNSPLELRLEKCNDRIFHNWTSNDSILNNENEPTAMVNRKYVNNNNSNKSRIPIVTLAGVWLDEDNFVCNNHTFGVRVILDPEDNNFNSSISTNVLNMFSTLKIDNIEISNLLTLDNGNAAFSMPKNANNVTITGTLADNNYQLSNIKDQKNGKPYVGTDDHWSFAKRPSNTNSFNENLSIYNPDCSNELVLVISRKVKKYNVEVVVGNGTLPVPSRNIICAQFDPKPSEHINYEMKNNGELNAFAHPTFEYSDSPDGKYCSKITHTTYFYYGQQPTLTPYFKPRSGYVLNKWCDDLGFTFSPYSDATLKIIQPVNDEDKLSKIMADELFQLKLIEVGVLDRDITLTDPNNIKSKKYRINDDPSLITYDLWDSEMYENFDKGIALNAALSTSSYGVLEHHKRTAKFIFTFNRPVNLQSLVKNLSVLEDGTEYKDMNNLKFTLRPDGLPITKYTFNTINNENNMIYNGADTKSVVFTLKNPVEEPTINGYNGGGSGFQGLSNMTRFKIMLRNNSTSDYRFGQGETNTQILSLETSPAKLSFPDANGTAEGITGTIAEKKEIKETVLFKSSSCLPSIFVNNFNVKNLNLDADPDGLDLGLFSLKGKQDVFIHTTALHELRLNDTKISTDIKNWKIVNNNIVYNTKSVRFPEDPGETGTNYNDDYNGTLTHNGDEFLTNKELIYVPNLYLGSEVIIHQDWFDKDGGTLASKFLNYAADIIDAVNGKVAQDKKDKLDTPLLPVNHHQDWWEWAIEKIPLVLREIAKDADSPDDFLGYTSMGLINSNSLVDNSWYDYYNIDNSIISIPQNALVSKSMLYNSDNTILYNLDRSNWGVGQFGMYKNIGRIARGGGSYSDKVTINYNGKPIDVPIYKEGRMQNMLLIKLGNLGF